MEIDPVVVSFGSQTTWWPRPYQYFWDSTGRDVRREIPGWPPPRRVNPFGWFWMRSVRLVMYVVDVVFSEMTNYRPAPKGSKGDPETEGHRLVVLRGDPGSIAWGAPWQLDLRLRPKGCLVRAEVEGRDLVLTVTVDGRVERVWRVPGDQVAGAELRYFGGYGQDPALRVHFTDGSWLRLDGSRAAAASFGIFAQRLGPVAA